MQSVIAYLQSKMLLWYHLLSEIIIIAFLLTGATTLTTEGGSEGER